MRKFCMLIIYLTAFCFYTSAQSGIQKVARSYFRSNPFATSFGTFVQHLVNDPMIKNKEFIRRTDSTLFFFTGEYQGFNPFFTKPRRITVGLGEFVAVVNDSIPPDTLYAYYLLLHYDYDKKGKKDMLKEFDRIHKMTRSDFTSTNTLENPEGFVGKLYNYFVPFHLLAPYALAWYDNAGRKDYYIAITLRLKPVMNETRLPFHMLEK